ncbi:type II toxin-antitoxin system VapC family toxin [Pleurocapsales cyanobacterium LEGE 06147]|nr:type II toxin-antitoxin system VapC family toxin [Pleurocapsales cyanobacterium LEGE 06147]
MKKSLGNKRNELSAEHIKENVNIKLNVNIVYLKGKSSNVNQRLKSLKRNNIALCSVVKAELFYGSMPSNKPKKALRVQKVFVDQFISLPFNDRCVLIYGKLRAKLAKAGTPIGSNDLLIASITVAYKPVGRSKILRVRLSEEEWKKLESYAKSKEYTMSEVIGDYIKRLTSNSSHQLR